MQDCRFLHCLLFSLNLLAYNILSWTICMRNNRDAHIHTYTKNYMKLYMYCITNLYDRSNKINYEHATAGHEL